MSKVTLLADINASIEKEARENHAVYLPITKFLPERSNVVPGQHVFKFCIQNFTVTIWSFMFLIIVIGLLVNYSNEKHYDDSELTAWIFALLVFLGFFVYRIYLHLTTRLTLSSNGIQYKKLDIIPWQNILALYIRIAENEWEEGVTDHCLVIYYEDMMYSKIHRLDCRTDYFKTNYMEVAGQAALYQSYYQRTY